MYMYVCMNECRHPRQEKVQISSQYCFSSMQMCARVFLFEIFVSRLPNFNSAAWPGLRVSDRNLKCRSSIKPEENKKMGEGESAHGMSVPKLYLLNTVSWNIRDRCYDFLNIFAQKFGEKNGVFDSKQS
jgi:hypothetical protein